MDPTVQEQIVDWLQGLLTVTSERLLQPATLYQLTAIAAASLIALLAYRATKRWLARGAAAAGEGNVISRLLHNAELIAFPILWLMLQWIYVLVSTQANWPHWMVQIVSSLLTAWVVIRLVSEFMVSSTWSKMLAVLVWSVAALSILGWLGPAQEALDMVAIRIGDTRISLLLVLKGIVLLGLLMWVALGVAALVERRLKSAHGVSPSVQVLFGKLFRILLIATALVVTLNAIGVDLTAFAVFGGALGVGLGFGLQKVVSNLVSGVILLLDKSVKPGDVIAVEGNYGWIDHLGARYTSVLTRDGIEHLIPNEELITQRVENWSHSNSYLRLRVPIGVSYNADVRKAIQLCLESAASNSRILQEPPPNCLLRGFGDSSVDLELRFWIDDPRNGRANVISEVLLGIWDRFHEHGVEIPFPQRDVHVRTLPEARDRAEESTVPNPSGES